MTAPERNGSGGLYVSRGFLAVLIPVVLGALAWGSVVIKGLYDVNASLRVIEVTVSDLKRASDKRAGQEAEIAVLKQQVEDERARTADNKRAIEALKAVIDAMRSTRGNP